MTGAAPHSFSHESAPWFEWLNDDLQQLVRHTHRLMEHDAPPETDFIDYTYLVFPMAKAYEGFIKVYLLRSGLISQKTYQSRRFRIGRSLNPDIRHSQRDKYWLYDDIERTCGATVARTLWETWLESRNRTFHFFPDNPVLMEYSAATEHIAAIERAMRLAATCQIEQHQGAD